MKYLWTVQSKEVIKILLDDKIYYPNIKKSNGYGEMKLIYPTLLESFNHINNSSYDGLLFAFYRENGGSYFETINDLYRYLFEKTAVSMAFNFWKSDYVILKIRIDEKINIMPLDFNDVIKLDIGKTKDIQRVMDLYDSIEKFNLDMRNIINFMNEGKENPYTGLKSFIEGHYPYLSIENIKGVYANFDYVASNRNHCVKVFDLFEEVEYLKSFISNLGQKS